MACRCLVGLEKGNCAFLGCFLMSAAGGFVYIYTRTRTRKGFGSVGLSFLFRKQNKVGSDTLTSLENKTRALGQAVNGRSCFSRSLSEKRQTVAGSVYVYVHTRARVGSVLSLSVVL